MEKITKLRKQVKTYATKYNNMTAMAGYGKKIEMLYDGELIGTYELWSMYEPDCKTPEEWLNGNICFEIRLKHRDIEKVTLRMV
jgi:hypothetical protein